MEDTHEVGEALPFELDRSIMAMLSGEPGEPLLRARLAAGSRSLLEGAVVALAMAVKWCGEMCRSTVGGKEATAVDMISVPGAEVEKASRCGVDFVVLVKRSLDRQALQQCSRLHVSALANSGTRSVACTSQLCSRGSRASSRPNVARAGTNDGGR